MTARITIFSKKDGGGKSEKAALKIRRFYFGTTFARFLSIFALIFIFCSLAVVRNASSTSTIVTFVANLTEDCNGANRLFAQESPTRRENSTGQIVFFSIPIAVDAAPIYSGPDENAYQTGVVAKNRFVEVYFRTENGWCAVRPPQGSFSWVNAKFVRLENATEGRVVSPGGKAVPARVGAATVEKSSIVQVGLKSNQKLKIVDKTTASNGSVWYKISPPPGEFRWIRDASLLADPALAKLPSKLTFQAEFLADLERQELANAQNKQLAQNDANNVGGADFTGTTEPETATLDAAEFKKQAIALNADVFQTLQKPTATNAELALLASRAEYLFDAAPGDSERFEIQTIYNAIKIAERQKAAATSTPQTPLPAGSTSGGFPTPPPVDGSAPNAPTGGSATPLYLPELSASPIFSKYPETSANSPNSATFANFGAFNGEIAAFNQRQNSIPPTSNGAVRRAETQSKNRLSFAFSDENNPFRFSKNQNVVVLADNLSSNDAKDDNFSKLPPLFPNGKRIIVPPANYRVAPSGRKARQNAKLVAAGEQKKDAKTATTQNALSAQLAQETQKTKETQRLTNDEFLTTQNARWRAVGSGESKSSSSGPIVPASATNAAKTSDSVPNDAPKRERAPKAPEVPRISASKIRQASDFQPIAVSTSSIFDAEGTLAALSDAPEGTPRFALVRPNGERYDVVRYLEPGDGVSLEKYLGQKIGVQGLNGTVVVDGTTRKLTIVRSVFSIK